jgi:DNA processing protein
VAVTKKEMTAWLRLLLTPGIGPVNACQLLSAFGLPEQIWDQSEDHLRAVIGRDRAQALLREPDDLAAQVDQTWNWLQQEHDGAQALMLTLGDLRYPKPLLNISDPPFVLFALVNPALLDLEPTAWQTALCERSIAIVGSRNPTPAGLLHARSFASELARAHCTVVSGLALGIDGAAHAGALEAGRGFSPACPSIAVVGTGLDRVYPRRHHRLAHDLARNGIVLSEHPLGTPAIAAHFPRRNRLIAGLSRATLVVEAAVDSGSLITARLAAEQGRDVLAIPGSINSPQSRGCHELIRQGARLVEGVQDVWEELGWEPVLPSATVCVSLSKEQTKRTNIKDNVVLQAIGYDPIGLDALQAMTGIDTASLQVQLFELEMGGVIGTMPGGQYQRLSAA